MSKFLSTWGVVPARTCVPFVMLHRTYVGALCSIFAQAGPEGGIELLLKESLKRILGARMICK
jgi:hypothetical protein